MEWSDRVERQKVPGSLTNGEPSYHISIFSKSGVEGCSELRLLGYLKLHPPRLKVLSSLGINNTFSHSVFFPNLSSFTDSGHQGQGLAAAMRTHCDGGEQAGVEGWSPSLPWSRCLDGAGSPGTPAFHPQHRGGVLPVLQDMVTTAGLLTPLLLNFQLKLKSWQESGTRPKKALFQLRVLGLELGQLM